MKITGSKTVSEVVKAFVPNGGAFRIEISGNATTIEAASVRPTVRVSPSDFFLALAGAGAVGEALLERAIRAASDRASGLNLSAQDAEATERLKERAEKMADEFASRLPMIERAGSVQVKGTAKDISGIAEHGFPDVLGVGKTKATPVLVPVA